jgi:hypothetical protein
MDLDWCTVENLLNTSKFNENSIISKEKKNRNTEPITELTNNDINIDNCFLINLDVKDNKNLLVILNYLSLISNHLRTLIRNKSTKYNEFTEWVQDFIFMGDTDLMIYIMKDFFDNIYNSYDFIPEKR